MFKLLIVGIIIAMLAPFVVWGVIAFVAFHFVTKFW